MDRMALNYLVNNNDALNFALVGLANENFRNLLAVPKMCLIGDTDTSYRGYIVLSSKLALLQKRDVDPCQTRQRID